MGTRPRVISSLRRPFAVIVVTIAAAHARAGDEPVRAGGEAVSFADDARALLEQIQSLDARREATQREQTVAIAARDEAQRSLEEARSRQRVLIASESRSRTAVGGGLFALWRLHGREMLSGLLGDDDRGRSARTWRNLGILVRYATAIMQVHSVRLADQSSLVSTLAERATGLRELERKVAAAERDLAHEQQAKRGLLANLLDERERAVEAASLAAQSLDRLTAEPTPHADAAPTHAGASRALRARTSFSAWRGRLKAPVDGAVVSRFGEERDQRGQTVVRSNGVRFAAEPDARVRATLDGLVVHRGYVPGLGNVVILEHGGDYFTVYGHLGEVRVLAGAEVARGETIATAGSSGLAEEPSVYFEIRHGGEALDPRRWLEPDDVDRRRAKGSRGRT